MSPYVTVALIMAASGAVGALIFGLFGRKEVTVIGMGIGLIISALACTWYANTPDKVVTEQSTLELRSLGTSFQMEGEMYLFRGSIEGGTGYKFMIDLTDVDGNTFSQMVEAKSDQVRIYETDAEEQKVIVNETERFGKIPFLIDYTVGYDIYVPEGSITESTTLDMGNSTEPGLIASE